MPQEPNGGRDNGALIWIDLEMTGLNPETDRIIEIATIITDSELNVLAEGPVLAVHQSNAVLAAMDDWNKKTHAGTGLIERVRLSALSDVDVERLTLEFVRRYVPKNRSPMCGNSICQDRRFLARLMPELEAWFHYRNLDVSTVKELARPWGLGAAPGFQKKTICSSSSWILSNSKCAFADILSHLCPSHVLPIDD